MRQMTERSAKWVATVKAHFATATGKPVEAWVALARENGFDEDVAQARKWLEEKKGPTMVQANFVLTELFPRDEANEGELLVAKVARGFGKDVMIAPRKSQVTLAREAR